MRYFQKKTPNEILINEESVFMGNRFVALLELNT